MKKYSAMELHSSQAMLDRVQRKANLEYEKKLKVWIKDKPLPVQILTRTRTSKRIKKSR